MVFLHENGVWMVSTDFYWHCSGFYRVLLGFHGLDSAQLGYYCVLLGFCCFVFVSFSTAIGFGWRWMRDCVVVQLGRHFGLTCGPPMPHRRRYRSPSRRPLIVEWTVSISSGHPLMSSIRRQREKRKGMGFFFWFALGVLTVFFFIEKKTSFSRIFFGGLNWIKGMRGWGKSGTRSVTMIGWRFQGRTHWNSTNNNNSNNNSNSNSNNNSNNSNEIVECCELATVNPPKKVQRIPENGFSISDQVKQQKGRGADRTGKRKVTTTTATTTTTTTNDVESDENWYSGAHGTANFGADTSPSIISFSFSWSWSKLVCRAKKKRHPTFDYCVFFPIFLPRLNGFHLPCVNGFYLVSTGFYWLWMGLNGFEWILLGFIGFYWVLMGFNGF